MTRHPDWTQRLAVYMADRAPRPFAWAANDCCTFAADAVVAITGTDPMQPLRGRYVTERGAARLIKTAGGLLPLVCQYLGQPMAVPLMAKRGDVAMFAMPEPYGPVALGVVVGSQIAAPGLDGRILLPLSAAQAAWTV